MTRRFEDEITIRDLADRLELVEDALRDLAAGRTPERVPTKRERAPLERAARTETKAKR